MTPPHCSWCIISWLCLAKYAFVITEISKDAFIHCLYKTAPCLTLLQSRHVAPLQKRVYWCLAHYCQCHSCKFSRACVKSDTGVCPLICKENKCHVQWKLNLIKGSRKLFSKFGNFSKIEYGIFRALNSIYSMLYCSDIERATVAPYSQSNDAPKVWLRVCESHW